MDIRLIPACFNHNVSIALFCIVSILGFSFLRSSCVYVVIIRLALCGFDLMPPVCTSVLLDAEKEKVVEERTTFKGSMRMLGS